MRISIKLIIRNLLKSISNTVINIIGLSIGMACAFTISLWVKNEFSFDKHLPDADRIYRLTFETNVSGTHFHFARCWEKWVWQMPETFPQIEEMVRLTPYRHTAIKIGENKLYSDRIFATDSNFFKVFGIGLLSGDTEKVLNDPYSAVISLALAKKCFGESDPVGQTILLSGEYDTKMVPFYIRGIMKETPANSHVQFDIVTSYANPQEAPSWAYVYLLLRSGSDPADVLAGLPSFIMEKEKEHDQTTFIPHLQKITDIHLYSDKDREIEPNGNITNIYLFVLAGIVLLLISWVNYFNLNKVRVQTLKKQIYIQRISGSADWRILIQSAAESAICVLTAFGLAIVLLDLLGYLYGSISGSSLFPDNASGLIIIWPIILAILFLSELVGILPVYLYVILRKNSFRGFKENLNPARQGLLSYGILMAVQFCFSLILMICAITIFRQKELLFSRSMGEMSSDILVFKKQNWEIRSRYKSFRDKALLNPLIKNFTASIEEPTGETLDAIKVESTGIDEEHKDRLLYFLAVEDNFLDFFNIRLISGRNFSPYNPERKGEDYILNETAVKHLGWTPEEAIGRPFNINFSTPDIFFGGTVVGVVQDFNYTTMKQDVKPYFLFQKPIFYLCFLVEVDSSRKEEAIMSLKKIWEEELPDYPFHYEFLNDMYNTAYKKELTQSKLTAFFSVLAMLIICLGLYAVTSVVVTRRTKEIGIRKVNGSGVTDIMIILTSDFIKLFAVAFVIACPIAFYIMQKWLQNFAYKTEISWWVFVISGIAVLAVIMFTVSLKSWHTAIKNPAEALRYE